MSKRSPHYRFGFIGLGRMAEVILRAMLNAKIASPREILVSRTSTEQLKRIKRNLKVATTSDNTAVAQRCDLLWIGVKPYQAQKVLAEIRPFLSPRHTLLSIMAGISTPFLKRHSGAVPHIIRLMPNTPALLGAGITGIFFPKNIPASTQKLILRISSAFGKTMVCPKEKDLDAITGLSGSGVAFVYQIAEGLAQGGIRSSLKSTDAYRIASQTLLGAARMLEAGDKSPEELIAQVVSKGGTTEAGMKVLKKNKVASFLAQAVLQASKRAKSLRKENDRCLP
jgi:pyrroline-5-carboxylate reductase